MKKLMMCLALILTGYIPGIAVGAQVDHQVGNGGGGICLAGVCSTLAEAGLRIPGPTDDFYLLSPTLVKAVTQLVNSLPLAGNQESYILNIVGQGATYKLVDVIEPEKLEQIRTKYADVLSHYQSSIDSKDVKIFAFASDNSSGAITYLLPEFFKLSLQQQVKVLIHEKNVRDFQAPQIFAAVLEFDGLIQDLLNNPKILLDPQFRLDRWIQLSEGFKGSSYEPNPRYAGRNMAAWFFWYKVNKGIVFETAKLCSTEQDILFYKCNVNIPLLTSNYEVSAAFVRALNMSSFTHYKDVGTIPPKPPKPTQVGPDGAQQACESALGNQNTVSILYPYKGQGPDYLMAIIECLGSPGGTVMMNIMPLY
jgi:hypothetical protein